MLAFPSNHYKDKFRGRKSTPKLSAYDIADSNVVNTQETSKVINDVSDRFKKVEESAVNLRVTADILEQNMKNFKM